MELNKEQQSENRSLMTVMGIVVLAVIAIAIIGFVFMNKPPEIIEGQAEGTTVRISGKLPGRVMEFLSLIHI